MDDWKEYERLACVEHTHLYNTHVTLHWSEIPHEWLVDSGFVNDINKYRIRRKEGGNIREYGLDGLALDSDGVFHGLQMKCWAPNQVLDASHLGTFVSVVYNRLVTKNESSVGHLYHTCKLQIDLREDFIYSGRIIAHRFVPDAPRSAPVEFEVPSEASYVLRDYQVQALAALNDFDFDESSVGVLTMPCGTGKTLVCGRYIAEKKPSIVLFIAPLIALVDQNLDRLHSFVPDYNLTKVHSGPGGCTDPDWVAEQLERNETTLIGATYDSFVDVLATFDFEDMDVLVVVDEAHNVITENERVRTALDDFERVVLVTATPPSAFEDFSTEIFTYKLGDAIAQKHVCDYNIWVPDVIHDPVRIPDDLEITGDLAGKALFLVNNMLLKGARRCIAYLTSHDEVVEFRALVERVASEYHTTPIWTGEIISTTRSRDDVFAQFQSVDSDAPDKLYVLCSIRILDEGIDLPKCDSVFVSNISEASSTTRMVQRMCRANRLDPDRPHKTSHVFLWNTDEFVRIVHVLDGLRDVDPEYVRKIRSASTGYTLDSVGVRTERSRVQTGELEAYVSVRAVSLEERALARASEYVKYLRENGRGPGSHTSLNRWMSNMRSAARGRSTSCILYESVRAYLNTEIPDWLLQNELKAIDQANAVVAFYNTHGVIPSQTIKLGRWFNHMRQAARGHKTSWKLYDSVRLIFDNNIPNWLPPLDAIEQKYLQNARDLYEFYQTHNGFPPRKLPLGRWVHEIRSIVRGQRPGRRSLPESLSLFLDTSLPEWLSIKAVRKF